MADTKRSSGGILGLLKETAIVVVGALIASTILRAFLLQVFVIPSRSMENTLLVGDRVAVQKVVPFQRGDIVVFRDDLRWLGASPREEVPVYKQVLMFIGLMPDETSNHLIKRVIGMPGDHVKCCTADGKIEVNGKAIDETAYLYTDPSGQQDQPSQWEFDLVVPRDRLFVMGDHRSNSQDSRCHLDESEADLAHIGAFVAQESVVGSTVTLVLPFDRFRTFGVPEAFASVPAPTSPAPEKPVVTVNKVNC